MKLQNRPIPGSLNQCLLLANRANWVLQLLVNSFEPNNTPRRHMDTHLKLSNIRGNREHLSEGGFK